MRNRSVSFFDILFVIPKGDSMTTDGGFRKLDLTPNLKYKKNSLFLTPQENKFCNNGY